MGCEEGRERKVKRETEASSSRASNAMVGRVEVALVEV